MTQQLTSILANNESKQRRPANHDKILAVLEKLPNNEAVADTIATYTTLDKVEVSRRMSELVALGKVIDTGRKGMTMKACKAIIWQLVKEPIPNIQQTLFGL